MLEPYPWQLPNWQNLQTAINNNKLPHALLLTGPDGIGLGHFAACLAARMLCHQSVNDTACGTCKSCILYQAGNHPDLVTIMPEEAGKQIKVDSIRDLINSVHLSSQYGHHKLVIINPAEAMNRSSANSLLKTLEEPPPDSVIILVSHQPTLVPITIRSRCQRINFASAQDKTTQQWLQDKLTNTKYDVSGLLQVFQGAPLKVLEMVKTEALDKQELLLQDLSALQSDSGDPVKMAEKWQGFGADITFRWLMTVFLQMARFKIDRSAAKTGDAGLSGYLQDLANPLDLTQLVTCYDLALQHYHAVTGPISLNKQGLLEDMIIYWRSLNRRVNQ